MKALVYTGAGSLDYRDVDLPVPAKDEALIRVKAVGICGSDMHAFLGHDERRPAPLILGHEAAGEVIRGERPGRAVTINPLVTCMECPACRGGRENLCARRQIISMPPREGAFAEYVCVPEHNLVDIPAGFDIMKAALAEPLACGWHAIRRAEAALDIPLADARALILGGGAIGIGAALALRALGGREATISEPHAGRRNYAINHVGLEARAPASLDQDSFDLIVDAVGLAASRRQASALVRPGGVIIHIGLGQADGGLDVRRITLQEITLIGTYTYTMEDFRQTAAAIFAGALGPVDWALSMPLSQGARAFSDLEHGDIDAPKVILVPA